MPRTTSDVLATRPVPPAFLAERPNGEFAHPHPDEDGRDRDYPRQPAFACGIEADRDERRGEHRKEAAEGAPSHADIMALLWASP